MKKYIMYHEAIEVSAKGLKQYGNIYNTHLAENGQRNGSYEIIGEYDTIETAREALKQYTSSVRLTSGFANVKFYSGDLYYFEESEYDEDYEEWIPGDGDSAKEEVEE